jgi:hypothetical protein
LSEKSNTLHNHRSFMLKWDLHVKMAPSCQDLSVPESTAHLPIIFSK